MEDVELYTVYISGKNAIDEFPARFDSYHLSTNLFLVRSNSTQSRLYHDLKKVFDPTELFVGKLKESPKFKGMNEGALKWVRKES